MCPKGNKDRQSFNPGNAGLRVLIRPSSKENASCNGAGCAARPTDLSWSQLIVVFS